MKTKRLNTLLLAAALLTTGGVYASWSYAEGPAAEATIHRLVNIASETVSSKKGTIDIVNNSLQFLVDQSSEGQYKAELVISGSLEIKFTPTPASSGTDPDVVEYGIPLEMAVTHTYGTWDHDGNPETAPIDVFEITDPGHVLKRGAKIKDPYTILSVPTAQQDDTNTTNVIENTGLSLHIRLKDNIILDTYDKYLSFKAFLEGEGKEIKITISEHTPTSV